MKEPSYKEALEAFANPFQEFSVEQVTNGLINQSYKVTDRNSRNSFLLQQINQHVFAEPEKIQQNYESLWKYINAKKTHLRIPEPKIFANQRIWYVDQNKRYWRIFEFIENTKTLAVAENIKEAGAVAETFATFTACFSNFNIEELQITIPDFHNVLLRFEQFKQVLKTASTERLDKSKVLFEKLLQRERYARLYEEFTVSGEFPKRIIHHDAKISNVLFDTKSGKIVCPVDFDTVMPGYFFSDLGDMIRTMTCKEDETSTSFDKIHIRKEFYDTIVSGYSGILKDQLTVSENKYIHAAGLLMIYMQALRFLTDYLQNDRYYQVSYNEHNHDRALNQTVLLEKLEVFLSENYNFICEV
ncbi:MAG: aminoglycoside phosphotransferase family protein [Chitinophagaceae bacterium]|nr:aminoglycoside phosphotransferase family protein [Chitinophagaceae bacterium]